MNESALLQKPKKNLQESQQLFENGFSIMTEKLRQQQAQARDRIVDNILKNVNNITGPEFSKEFLTTQLNQELIKNRAVVFLDNQRFIHIDKVKAIFVTFRKEKLEELKNISSEFTQENPFENLDKTSENTTDIKEEQLLLKGYESIDTPKAKQAIQKSKELSQYIDNQFDLYELSSEQSQQLQIDLKNTLEGMRMLYTDFIDSPNQEEKEFLQTTQFLDAIDLYEKAINRKIADEIITELLAKPDINNSLVIDQEQTISTELPPVYQDNDIEIYDEDDDIKNEVIPKKETTVFNPIKSLEQTKANTKTRRSQQETVKINPTPEAIVNNFKIEQAFQEALDDDLSSSNQYTGKIAPPPAQKQPENPWNKFKISKKSA